MEEKVKLFEEELKQLLIKHELEPHYYIDFPMYKVFPAEVQLALVVLQKHSYKIMAAYKERSKPQNVENKN